MRRGGRTGHPPPSGLRGGIAKTARVKSGAAARLWALTRSFREMHNYRWPGMATFLFPQTLFFIKRNVRYLIIFLRED
jgi:hypothetical protein